MPNGSDHEDHFGTKYAMSAPPEDPIMLSTKNRTPNQFYKGFLRIPKNRYNVLSESMPFQYVITRVRTTYITYNIRYKMYMCLMSLV